MPEAEVIAVPDEPVATRIPDAQLQHQQQQVAAQEAAARQPAATTPGQDGEESAVPEAPHGLEFNSMRDKLSALLKEASNPAKEPAKPEPAKQAEKKPAVEAKTEPKAEPTDPKQPTKITSKTAENWKKLEDKVRERETKIAEWEAKFAAKEKELAETAAKFQAQDKTPEYQRQIDEWKTKTEQFGSELEKLALERYEPFNRYYAQQFETAIKKAKESVGSEKAELIEQLLSVPPSKWRKEQINTIRQGLEGYDQGQLDIAVATMDSARAEKEQKLANHKVEYERMLGVEAERAQRQEQMSKARTEATISKVMQLARNYDAFKPSDDPERNLQVKMNEENVAKFFRMELAPEDMAILPIIAAEGKRVIETVLPALQKENAELREALAAHQTAKPSLEGGKETAASTEPEGFIAAFQRNWPGNQP